MDRGAQNERTALAWQRTALAMIAGSAVLTRLTVGRIGPLALAGMAVTVSLGLVVLVAARRRYQQGRRGRTGGAGLPLAVVAGTVTMIVVELLALLPPG
ncbi:uncharacterized membrane protein YidH (DUF202 family) [Saccharothrix tamanrassetensis]|uniref:Uncharacterized membrane protein YidH (DUF202 family) n=1 Tax=Saccharothrix tamanrassetensis TaxID=1051531 RepID=A0A841CMB0_9PSEU|nr:DUF202 domain-containing protein [Saccharothrix tamanrassetensis]MBB5958073.1 uncharacterized membrane protein YidH (DUF202 family) [Saccharothrix tamanrassetensis]